MADFYVSFPGLGIHDLPLRRVAINVFGFPIYWYGVIAAFSMALAMGLALRRAHKFGFVKEDLLDYFIALVPGVLIGARLYYVAFAWSEFKNNLGSIFDTRTGGMAFYGGVIGGCLALGLMALYKRQNLIKLLDYLAPYLALGQGIGRFANFFNQEAFGINTTLPWGMISNGTKQYLSQVNLPGIDPNLPVHPTFLYEFLGNMLFFALLVALQNWQRKQAFKKGGLIMAAYCCLYGMLRYFVEGIRTDALMIGQSTWRISQVLSLVMVLLGLFYILYYFYKRARAYEAGLLITEPKGEAGEALEKLAVLESAETAEMAEAAKTVEAAEVVEATEVAEGVEAAEVAEIAETESESETFTSSEQVVSEEAEHA